MVHLHSWSEPQILAPVTKHLSVVLGFMMCTVGLGICVWTVQAAGFNCSLPLKLIQKHLDPLSAGTAWDLSLSLLQSGCLCLSLALPLLLCCQVYLSFQLPWTILFRCHSVVRVTCMWVFKGYLISGGNIWMQHNLERSLRKYTHTQLGFFFTHFTWEQIESNAVCTEQEVRKDGWRKATFWFNSSGKLTIFHDSCMRNGELSETCAPCETLLGKLPQVIC